MQEIRLTKKHSIDVFQIALTLRKKDNKSPFIAVLLCLCELEQKQADIDFDMAVAHIRAHLLAPLPLPICKNLIHRLVAQSYIEEYPKRTNRYNTKTYLRLSTKGIKAAENRHFWQSEKGIYNLYFADIFDNKNLIHIEKAKKIESNHEKSHNNNKERPNPDFIRELGEKSLSGVDYAFDEISDKHFPMPQEKWDLIWETKGEGSQIILEKPSNIKEYIPLKECSFEAIKAALLSNAGNLQYDYQAKHCLCAFDPKNLLLLRSVKIDKPRIEELVFESLTIDGVEYQPTNLAEAQKWYMALLTEEIKDYIFSEEEYIKKSEAIRRKFSKYPELAFVNLVQLLPHLNFYQRAKLETIYYLTY